MRRRLTRSELEEFRTREVSSQDQKSDQRPDSAGYRAGKDGKDGKDLGADVDLTPEYEVWLEDTGQKK
jgi:hypothetical protein